MNVFKKAGFHSVLEPFCYGLKITTCLINVLQSERALFTSALGCYDDMIHDICAESAPFRAHLPCQTNKTKGNHETQNTQRGHLMLISVHLNRDSRTIKTKPLSRTHTGLVLHLIQPVGGRMVPVLLEAEWTVHQWPQGGANVHA